MKLKALTTSKTCNTDKCMQTLRQRDSRCNELYQNAGGRCTMKKHIITIGCGSYSLDSFAEASIVASILSKARRADYAYSYSKHVEEFKEVRVEIKVNTEVYTLEDQELDATCDGCDGGASTEENPDAIC